MGRWQVELTGQVFDLEDLPGLFTAHALRVVEDDGRYFLEADQLEALSEGSAVHNAARELLPWINGVAKLKNGSFHDVAAGSIREHDEDGAIRQHVVIEPATVEVRAKVSAVLIGAGEEEPTPPAPGSSIRMFGCAQPPQMPKPLERLSCGVGSTTRSGSGRCGSSCVTTRACRSTRIFAAGSCRL